MHLLPVLLLFALALPAFASAPQPTPAPEDVPAPEPAQLSLAGAPCQGVARYLSVGNARGGELSPDGRWLLFRSDATGLNQLYVAPADGNGPGTPLQLTFGANEVRDASWRPDGKWIQYGTDRSGNERIQFFLISPDGLRERALTPADMHFRLFGDWAPDGRQFAYTSNERNGRDFDLYLLAVSDDGEPGAPRLVLEGSGNLGVQAWRPDGGALVLARGRGEADNDLLLLDLASGKLEPLLAPEAMSRHDQVQWRPDGTGFWLVTNNGRDRAGVAWFAPQSERLQWIAEPGHDVDLMALSPDGTRLAYTLNVDGYSRLVLRALDDAGETQVELPDGVVTKLHWARNAARLAIGVSGPAVPNDVWMHDAASGRTTRATASRLAGLDPAAFVQPEAVTLPALDGETLYGLLYLPRAANGPSGGRRPPVVLALHGGPTAQARPDFDGVLQYLLARGYAVLDLNFRGSTGYGQRFTQLDNGRKRPDVVGDLQAAVQWLRTRRDVDGRRVAAMGGSYGGYLTLAAVAQLPDYFQAGVDFVGVANWITGLEDASPQLRNSDRIEYGDIDDPEDRAFFERISPLSYATDIRSPLLVVHGANDPRVPVAEADQIVRAVRARGGDVEYLRFPDEGHGLARLANRVTAYQRIARFLDRTLGHESRACAVASGSGT